MKKTRAVLTLILVDEEVITVSTQGTRAARGKLKSWILSWGDGTYNSGNNNPPLNLTHSYLNTDTYTVELIVVDSKDIEAKDSFTVLIVRNPVVTPPATPTALVTSLPGGNQINLTWVDNATNETGYEVQRQVNGGSWETRIMLPFNSTSFQDTQVGP